MKVNIICIPESFNMNISHQLIDFEITFVNSQLEFTNSKGDFVLKKPVLNGRLKKSGIQKCIYELRF